MTSELLALVGDDVLGYGVLSAEHPAEKPLDFERRGDALKECDAHRAPGVVIERHGDPPAMRPPLRNSERKPRSPEAPGDRHGREVDVKDRIGPLGGQPPAGIRRRLSLKQSGWLPQHAPHGRRAEVKTSGEHLGDLRLAEGGAEYLQPLDDVADEAKENRASEITWSMADRTRRVQDFGRGRVGCLVIAAMDAREQVL